MCAATLLSVVLSQINKHVCLTVLPYNMCAGHDPHISSNHSIDDWHEKTRIKTSIESTCSLAHTCQSHIPSPCLSYVPFLLMVRLHNQNLWPFHAQTLNPTHAVTLEISNSSNVHSLSSFQASILSERERSDCELAGTSVANAAALAAVEQERDEQKVGGGVSYKIRLGFKVCLRHVIRESVGQIEYTLRR